MNNRLSGLDDDELVSITLTGKEVRYLEAASRFVMASEGETLDQEHYHTLRKLSKKFKEYL